MKWEGGTVRALSHGYVLCFGPKLKIGAQHYAPYLPYVCLQSQWRTGKDREREVFLQGTIYQRVRGQYGFRGQEERGNEA